MLLSANLEECNGRLTTFMNDGQSGAVCLEIPTFSSNSPKTASKVSSIPATSLLKGSKEGTLRLISRNEVVSDVNASFASSTTSAPGHKNAFSIHSSASALILFSISHATNQPQRTSFGDCSSDGTPS